MWQEGTDKEAIASQEGKQNRRLRAMILEPNLGPGTPQLGGPGQLTDAGLFCH